MTESAFVKLARETIESYVKSGKTISAPAPLPAELSACAGVFVSLKKGGALRGCIGTFEPTTENIANEIIANAVSASARDPRFPPVKADELSELEISVDVLSKPEKVSSTKELDAKKYGVIVSARGRKGLLLPDLEGVDTPEAQIAIAMRKSGIGENEPMELFRFEVKRYH
jgi:AmmeMemoRadiSam system protein A